MVEVEKCSHDSLLEVSPAKISNGEVELPSDGELSSEEPCKEPSTQESSKGSGRSGVG